MIYMKSDEKVNEKAYNMISIADFSSTVGVGEQKISMTVFFQALAIWNKLPDHLRLPASNSATSSRKH